MINIPPIIDNLDETLEDTYNKLIPEIEEARIATGYFYLSGFNLYRDDLETLADPDDLGRAPLRLLMGEQTNRETVEEIGEGQSLRDRVETEFKASIEELNNAQLDQIDRLRDFIAEGYVDVRVRAPENGYFHAKGAAFRAPDEKSEGVGVDEDDTRPCAAIVGSSNFTQSGHQNNIELNLTSRDQYRVEAFENWYDNQWANAEEFSEEILQIIENSDKYQDWKETQDKKSSDSASKEHPLGTHLEPFEIYKLLAYDELNGNIGVRDSPLYYFQKLGYESAKEKLSQFNGCIVSDSVGLGKSFIGGELLHDYRQKGEQCLLIVPANLTEQWRDLLQDDTDESGNPYFGLDVDGTHLDIMSINKFQNLTYQQVQKLKDQYGVVLLDEAHRFRNHGRWNPDPDDEDDYNGTRRHANIRELRGKTMIMLTATPINNSATDLKNLISLFSDSEEIQNKASLDFDAFDEYIEKSKDQKQIAAGELEATEAEQRELTEEMNRHSEEISNILNEVMVLRTRKHVKDQIQSDEDFEMSFDPPTLHKEEYSLPGAYQPIYRDLPDVMDALHLPHIVVKNPKSGDALKALYKLNLLKRLESSTYAFVQSIKTLHGSERDLLNLLEGFPDDEQIQMIHEREGEDEFADAESGGGEIETTLEEFGIDRGSVHNDHAGGESGSMGLELTVREVKRQINEDLTLLSYFLSRFISDVAEDAGEVNDHSVTTRDWLRDHDAATLPEIDPETHPTSIYPVNDLTGANEATADFFESVFELQDFRDPKIDRLSDVIGNRDGKILVFTQYRGTAEYVYRKLLNDPSTPLTGANSEVVKGGSGDKQGVINRFAPEASGTTQELSDSDQTELQYVVATDTLSEGVNLQDVHTVVNYDLPWNPMRIVQRVGRVDRIGTEAEKHVHNFYPDGDIEAAIKLLKRLQAKINDIALIVGKENNILDPNENQILNQTRAESEKTIGELEIDEIEDSLRNTREIDDVNELDDTSKNPLLRNAGSNEGEAYERILLKDELLEDHGLDPEAFDYAEDYFSGHPRDREVLYTNATEHDAGTRPGVFGLAHIWFEDEVDQHSLGRVRRVFYYRPFGGDVTEKPVRSLKLSPGVTGEALTESAETVISNREEIRSEIDSQLESIQSGQTETIFNSGSSFSKEQETLLDYLTQYVKPQHGSEGAAHTEYSEIGEWADDLYDQLDGVRLDGTAEDRVLRDTFRKNEEYESLTEWPPNEFLATLDGFIEENIDQSTEFQTELVGESEVHARLVCWGVISTS
jgi:superfamily II DNA or RNA helicase/HKD family nuclease